jgi:hypothetical protein
VVRLTNPDYVPARPPRSPPGACLIVWEAERDEAPVRAWIREALDVDLGGNPVRVLEPPHHFARTARLRVAYVLLPEGRGDCR